MCHTSQNIKTLLLITHLHRYHKFHLNHHTHTHTHKTSNYKHCTDILSLPGCTSCPSKHKQYYGQGQESRLSELENIRQTHHVTWHMMSQTHHVNTLVFTSCQHTGLHWIQQYHEAFEAPCQHLDSPTIPHMPIKTHPTGNITKRANGHAGLHGRRGYHCTTMLFVEIVKDFGP